MQIFDGSFSRFMGFQNLQPKTQFTHHGNNKALVSRSTEVDFGESLLASEMKEPEIHSAYWQRLPESCGQGERSSDHRSGR
jgi:hypothetical protein